MSLRSATPCQCTLVGCGIRLVNVARRMSPFVTRIPPAWAGVSPAHLSPPSPGLPRAAAAGAVRMTDTAFAGTGTRYLTEIRSGQFAAVVLRAYRPVEARGVRGGAGGDLLHGQA